MANEPPEVFWNKTTGRNEVEVPYMSKVVMTELFKELQAPNITKDEAVSKIWLSDLEDIEKIIVAVNIGEYKEKTKLERWIRINYAVQIYKLKRMFGKNEIQ